jgi:serine/threonine protein kinase
MSDKQSQLNNSMNFGTMLGQYRLEELIASGGMARIYKAVDTNLERTVAVKILMPELIELDDTLIERFEREAKAVAQLEHDNIVRIYDYRRQDDRYYIVMNYIEGYDLADELNQLRRENKLMEISKALPLLAQVAGALDFAHAAGIVHRDVKPSNVLMTKSGKAILTDFGLVLRQSIDKTLGTAFGTPRYIAPEQALASENSVPQSDIYSLAVITYEMLTGQMLFFSENPMQIAMSHINDRPTPPRSINPTIPLAAEREILKALAKRPVERHRSASEFVSALKKAYREMAMSLKDMPSGQASQQTLVLSDDDNSRELLKNAFDQNLQTTQPLQPVQASQTSPTRDVAAQQADEAAALLASWDDPSPAPVESTSVVEAPAVSSLDVTASASEPAASASTSRSTAEPVSSSTAPVASKPSAASSAARSAPTPPLPSIPSVLPPAAPASRAGNLSAAKSTAESKGVKAVQGVSQPSSRQWGSVLALMAVLVVALGIVGALILLNNPPQKDNVSGVDGVNAVNENQNTNSADSEVGDDNPVVVARALTLPPITSVPATAMPTLATVTGGQAVRLDYDDHILVLRNLDSTPLNVAALELVKPAGEGVNGTGIENRSVPSEKCVGIVQRGYTINARQWDCAAGAYHDEVTINGQQLFWRTPQPDQFIVRLNGTAIAYCPTIQRGGKQTCEFNVPAAALN